MQEKERPPEYNILDILIADRKLKSSSSFLCHTCGRNFTSQSGLTRHQDRLHKGDTPRDRIVCDSCGKAFQATLRSLASELFYSHKTSCMKKVNKKCKKCGLIIGNKRKREQHERNCGLQKCEKCDREFPTYAGLVIHIRSCT